MWTNTLLFSRHRIFKSGPIRAAYFILFVTFFFVTEIGRELYRPFIYRNGYNDFGFADVIGNLLGTVAIIFFLLTAYHATKRQSIRVISFVTVGIMAYELVQPTLPKGVFDWKDVVSTPIAGLISLMMVMILLNSERLLI